eukprot:492475_1
MTKTTNFVYCVLIIAVIALIYIIYVESILKIPNLPRKEELRRAYTRFKSFNLHTRLDGNYCDNISSNGYNTYYQKYNLNNNNTISESRKRIFLLSYPRSGNHLTRSILECLLNYASYGYKREKNSIYIIRKKREREAIHDATHKQPYIRKYHVVEHIINASNSYQFGLIFLVRDPIECIISQTKHLQYFWRNYEFEMNGLLDLATFYLHWGNNKTKLLLYYEDFFNNDSIKWINLLKIQSFFGKHIVSNKRLNYCIEHFDNITNIAFGALKRTAKSSINLHYYRDIYYGNNADVWPLINVPHLQYKNVFQRYENVQSCSSNSFRG